MKRRPELGSAMVEFLIVGPLLWMIALSIVQIALLFVARTEVDYATFMAARAGSTGHAEFSAMRDAYLLAAIPMYGGGSSSAELASAYLRASSDLLIGGHLLLRMTNPTTASYADWGDPTLRAFEGDNGAPAPGCGTPTHRVIPGQNLAYWSSADIGPTSKQSIHDASVLKLEVVQGVRPVIPLADTLFLDVMRAEDPHARTVTGLFYTEQLAQGRFPVRSEVTLQMQSDAYEPKR